MHLRLFEGVLRYRYFAGHCRQKILLPHIALLFILEVFDNVVLCFDLVIQSAESLLDDSRYISPLLSTLWSLSNVVKVTAAFVNA